VPSARRRVSYVMLLIAMFGAVAGSVAFGLPLAVALVFCIGGMGLSLLLARWFGRKTGLDLYRERLEKSHAIKRAAENEQQDAR